MSIEEYFDMYKKAQIIGTYQVFVFDIVGSRTYSNKSVITRENLRIQIFQMLDMMYKSLEEKEKLENKKILHKKEYFNNCVLEKKHFKIGRADMMEPFVLVGDLFGFTILYGSISEEEIEKLYLDCMNKLGFIWDTHRGNARYETDDWNYGNELFFRGYAIQWAEKLSKIKKGDGNENRKYRIKK